MSRVAPHFFIVLARSVKLEMINLPTLIVIMVPRRKNIKDVPNVFGFSKFIFFAPFICL